MMLGHFAKNLKKNVLMFSVVENENVQECLENILRYLITHVHALFYQV